MQSTNLFSQRSTNNSSKIQELEEVRPLEIKIRKDALASHFLKHNR